jgi:hypothetical protein
MLSCENTWKDIEDSGTMVAIVPIVVAVKLVKIKGGMRWTRVSYLISSN